MYFIMDIWKVDVKYAGKPEHALGSLLDDEYLFLKYYFQVELQTTSERIQPEVTDLPYKLLIHPVTHLNEFSEFFSLLEPF